MPYSSLAAVGTDPIYRPTANATSTSLPALGNEHSTYNLSMTKEIKDVPIFEAERVLECGNTLGEGESCPQLDSDR